MRAINSSLLMVSMLLSVGCSQGNDTEGDTDTSAPTPFTMPQVEHVVVIGVDGMGGLFVTGPQTPTLDRLMQEGAYSFHMQNVLPTSSSTNWMSMLNGQGTDGHGVYSNSWSVGESEPAQTIVQLLRSQKPDATIGVFYDWGDFGRLVEDGVADEKLDPGDENETAAAAIDFIKMNQPDLTFIHLDHVDHAGHATGWYKSNDDCFLVDGCPYIDAVEHADQLIAEILTAIEDTGMKDKTAVLISSDHGGMFTGHGGDTFDERCIPFFVMAPGVRPGPIDRVSRIFDIPATAASFLGLELPQAWVGRPVLDAMDGYTLPHASSGTIEHLMVSDYTKLYDDTGSGAQNDLTIWRPVVPEGYVHLGDVAVADNRLSPEFSVPVIKANETIAIAPIGYELLWSDEGSGSDSEQAGEGISIWHGIAPAGYTCVGAIAVSGYDVAPALDASRCIHDDFLTSGSRQMIWNDAGTGSDLDGAIWDCTSEDSGALSTYTFVSRRSHLEAGMDLCRSLKSEMLR